MINVRSHGAQGDGEHLDTDSINRAIEEAAGIGGGTVFFPAGTYISGSIHLQNNITLFLDAGCVLEGAPNDINAYDPPEDLGFPAYQDFGHSHWHNSLIWGEDLENVAITGPGAIHGGGMVRGSSKAGGGDKAIALKLCRNVLIENVTIRDAGHFAVLATCCDNVRIHALDINTNRGGINIDACHNVTISDCLINSIRYGTDSDGNPHPEGGDDAIALKSSYALGRARSCENITISNCVIAAGCNAIQFGSESNGDFRNVSISNCVVVNSKKAGIGITCNDGGTIDGVVVSNVSMTNTATPIFIKLSNRARGPEGTPVGRIQNVRISHIVATDIHDFIAGRRSTATIAGLPRRPLSNISLNDIFMEYKGRMPAQPSVDIATDLDETIGYSPRKMGTRPAYGLYCAYVDGLSIRDVRVGFEESDERPALVCHNVNGLNVSGFQCERAENQPVPVIFQDVTSLFLGGNPSIPEVDALCETLTGPGEPVPVGTNFSVTALVKSRTEGIATPTLSIEGKRTKTEYVWLKGETPEDVAFPDLSLDKPGEYRLSVGDAHTRITVVEASDVSE